MNRLIRAVIDTRALRHNLKTLRERARGARVMAVVKANAYGHGLIPTALALAEADAFAVARLEEGLALRAAGIVQPIVLLEGVVAPEQLLEAARHGFDLVVHDALQIELLEGMSVPHRFVLWIKIDTGMNRLGFRPEAFPAALERIRGLKCPPLEIRLLTHLARADEPEEPLTSQQVACFRKAVAGLGCAVSLANSAGLLRGITGCDWTAERGLAPPSSATGPATWVRPGLALYGASPFPGSTGLDLGLEPVMTLETSVLAVRRVPPGETVGYGGVWRAGRDSQVAIVAAGYGDGLPRNLPNGTPVLIGGHLLPLAGRVSMDMIAVDVTGVSGIGVGTLATLWGHRLPVEDVARHAGTIPYELLCSVSQRVPVELR